MENREMERQTYAEIERWKDRETESQIEKHLISKPHIAS
jgi:hypothetical protein